MNALSGGEIRYASERVSLCFANPPRKMSKATRAAFMSSSLTMDEEAGGELIPAAMISPQALFFLNRRGYAPTLLCTACGWVAPCQECDARLTVHLSAGRLRCHHCGDRGR